MLCFCSIRTSLQVVVNVFFLLFVFVLFQRRESYGRYTRDDRRERDYDYHDDRRRDWRDDHRYDPSSVVMIKGFPLEATEDDVSSSGEKKTP